MEKRKGKWYESYQFPFFMLSHQLFTAKSAYLSNLKKINSLNLHKIFEDRFLLEEIIKGTYTKKKFQSVVGYFFSNY